ncbi:RNAse III [Thermosyntropha lipolytica DSM 11003]|uniref:Ribonuclease 3 n=1 Tax=Thermosyntropha lipolytica DSM 11003 TaxID=1123382 RepID=A0A1M5PIS2_9FIRM|nr:ribonuclease III [Thermosyntropha lipolytica]SHH01672.1 RNAse III [Thermosyntropha lipolytica DSM 11003]
MPNDLENAVRFLQDNDLWFKNPELIRMALTHPSYAQEKNSLFNNQRLEFLGDAVLNFIVAEYLYNNYPDKPEGDLTRIRAKVVCEKSLVKVAQKINLGDYLLLGKGEEKSGGRKRKSILADAVEAVIGAIYLDQGYEKARDFILLHLKDYIAESAQGDYCDYKSRLQEMVQAKSSENVSYSIIKETGPAHCKNFVAGVFFQGKLIATGEGKSKKEAEQNAAEKVLKEGLLPFEVEKGK